MTMQFKSWGAFSQSHGAIMTQGLLADDAHKAYFAEHFLPRLDNARLMDKDGIVVGYDKTNPEYKAMREEYKAAVLPAWIGYEDAKNVPVHIDGTILSASVAMMDSDTYRKLSNGAFKDVVTEKRERIKNSCDQGWSRLQPKFAKAKPVTTWAEDVTNAIKPLKSDGVDNARDAKRTAAGVTLADLDVAMLIATVGFKAAMQSIGKAK